jgi:CPA2 family monovalent cation:H+ antiporter-2
MLLPEQGRDLILAGAIISILLNPFLFSALDGLLARQEAKAKGSESEAEAATDAPIASTALEDHVVLVGHGRVGKAVSQVLGERGIKLFVIEDDKDEIAEVKARGIAAVVGNAADPHVIEAANLPAARCLLFAIPDAFEGGQVVQQARAINPALTIVARAHSEAEILHLKKHGATLVIMGEHEIAMAMVEHVATRTETGAKA